MARKFGKPCWLYRIYDAAGCLLYVGIADKLARRFWQHHRSRAAWIEEMEKSVVALFPTRRRAEQAERLAIFNEKPRYNRRGALKEKKA